MAFEKRWAELSPRLLTVDGTSGGQLQIPDAFLLKVKQTILLKSNTQGTLKLQVKRVTGPTTFFVGRLDENIDDRVDVSAYLVADGANISAPDPYQSRNKIAWEEYARAVYDEEPTVAIRTILVDRGGRYIGSDPDAPFFVELADTSLSVNIQSATTPIIENIAIPAAGVEQSFLIPTDTKGFRAKLRNLGGGPAKLQVAFVAGESSTNFVSVAPGSWYTPPTQLDTLSGLTMFFQATKDDQVLEFEGWT